MFPRAIAGGDARAARSRETRLTMADLRFMIVEGRDPAAVVEFIRTNPVDASG
jgi:hypothetical protein